MWIKTYKKNNLEEISEMGGERMVKKLRWKVVIAMLLCCVAGVMDYGVYEVKADTYEQEGAVWYYRDLGDNKVEIYGYSGESTEVVIPSELGEKRVTSIDFLSAYSDTLTSITIPESAEYVFFSFEDSYNHLESIIVDDGNAVYDSRENCNAIIKKNGNELVTGCQNTFIPDSVKKIGSYAFWHCDGLTDIEIPNSVTSIEISAFCRCRGLTSIKIPSGVTNIETAAFSWCSGLTSIEVDDGNTVYDSREDCEAIIKKEGNELILGCKNTTIPEGIEKIGVAAFSECVGLTSIEIPNSVTSIGSSAFSWCRGLTSIEIPSSTTSIGAFAFIGCSGLTSIEIPSSVTSIEASAFSWCSGLTSIKIPNSVTSIEAYAFNGCSGLTSIEIPSSVTSIENSVFDGCSGLTSIEIPSSITSIGAYAFDGCTGLTSIKIPSSVTSIGQSAFSNCARLTTVTIPNGETSIGDNAFSRDVTIWTIKGSAVERWAKKYNIKVEYITHSDITPPSTGNDGQTGGDSGNQSSLPKVGTQKIVSNGVYKVTKSSATTKEVTFVKPKNSKKTSLTILDNIKIDGQTYKVTEVAAKAFKNKKKLKSVKIGKNVKKIGKETFFGCKNLKKITIKSTTLKTVGKNAIKGINKKAAIKCPKKQLEKYKKLFKKKTGYKKTMKIK